MMLPQQRNQSLDGIRDRVLSNADAAIVHAYYGVESQQHPYYAQALAAGVNRWLESEYLDKEPRLFASATIAPQDTQGAVAELRRVAANKRFIQVLLPARAPEPYGSQRYWPIWEAAAEEGMAIAITYGGSTGTPQTPNGWMSSLFEEYTSFQQVFEAHVMSMVASGIFAKLPDLKLVVMESGWTWLPGLMWRMDTEWHTARREVPWVELPPSEYVKRHVRFTTLPIDSSSSPKHLEELLEQLGSSELLMYGSDFPRTYEPSMENLLAVMDAEQRDRVLWSNAAETYKISLPSSASPAPAG
ncbi:MAG TPA: amidohydrolase family protein [Solirubrobacteraceae bacterium]